MFTRPFGATFGNFLDKPITKVGLELETLPATSGFLALIGILMYVFHREMDKKYLNGIA